jgi:hypothetical protein
VESGGGSDPLGDLVELAARIGHQFFRDFDLCFFRVGCFDGTSEVVTVAGIGDTDGPADVAVVYIDPPDHADRRFLAAARAMRDMAARIALSARTARSAGSSRPSGSTSRS